MTQNILTLYEKDISSTTSVISDRADFYHRPSVRAVFFDSQGSIALMYSVKFSYYKLPGGGVDEGESLEVALTRELLEETGCESENLVQLGEVIEYRDFARMVQQSVCYTAHAKNHGTPTPTDEEIAEEFEVVWAKDIDDAIKLVNSAEPESNDLQIKFMVKRDAAILAAAKARANSQA